MRSFAIISIIVLSETMTPYARSPSLQRDDHKWPMMNSRQSVSSTCGISSPERSERRFPDLSIVAGNLTRKNELPWMGHLSTLTGACTSTLISRSWVLTAAHCTPDDAADFAVSFGCPDCVKHSVSKKIVHEEFNYPFNDIALLKLTAPVQFSDAIRPICLPTSPVSGKGGETLIAAGWGLQRGELVTDQLKKATMITSSTAVCRETYANPHLICAYRGDGSICNGDSGGFLGHERKSDGRYVQDGLPSIMLGSTDANGCNATLWPTGFSDVYFYKPWIIRNANGEPEDIACRFPFVYRGVTYNSCTTEGSPGRPWCYYSLQSDGEGVQGEWIYCD